jgi:4-alpha-glucanotransferase
VLKLATLDDLTLAAERPNMPGTTVERPNWRLPLPMRVEEISTSPVVAASVAALADRTA